MFPLIPLYVHQGIVLYYASHDSLKSGTLLRKVQSSPSQKVERGAIHLKHLFNRFHRHRVAIVHRLATRFKPSQRKSFSDVVTCLFIRYYVIGKQNTIENSWIYAQTGHRMYGMCSIPHKSQSMFCVIFRLERIERKGNSFVGQARKRPQSSKGRLSRMYGIVMIEQGVQTCHKFVIGKLHDVLEIRQLQRPHNTEIIAPQR